MEDKNLEHKVPDTTAPVVGENTTAHGNQAPTIQPDPSFAQEVRLDKDILSPVSTTEASETAGIYPDTVMKDETIAGDVDTSKGYEEAADSILKEQKKDRIMVSTLDEMASDAAPDLQSKLTWKNKFLSDIGMSWFTWLLIEFVIGGLVFLLHWPRIAYSAIIIPITIYLIIKRS